MDRHGDDRDRDRDGPPQDGRQPDERDEQEERGRRVEDRAVADLVRPADLPRPVRRAGVEQALGRVDVPAVVEPERRVRQPLLDEDEDDPEHLEPDDRREDDPGEPGEARVAGSPAGRLDRSRSRRSCDALAGGSWSSRLLSCAPASAAGRSPRCRGPPRAGTGRSSRGRRASATEPATPSVPADREHRADLGGRRGRREQVQREDDRRRRRRPRGRAGPGRRAAGRRGRRYA